MKRAVLVALLLIASIARADNTLRVISAGPNGEVATLAETNEIRVVFSEAMVVLGRIPPVVVAPFFHIEPQVIGALRWSGTTTLIFTPAKKLPYAATYNVTIDATAKSVAGNTLSAPYRFSFATPRVKLLNTNWYRQADRALVIGLRFNQGVAAASVLPKLQIKTFGRPFEQPIAPAEGVDRTTFDAKRK